MPIRRRTDPIDVQCIWDAFRQLTFTKASTEHDKFVKHLIKINGFTSQEWNECIAKSVEDKLIEPWTRRDQTSTYYRLPLTEMPLMDGKDWYCFECHQAGDVNLCKNKSCHRVYHKNCVSHSALENFQLFKNLFDKSDSTVFLKTGNLDRRKSLCWETDGIEIVESGSIPVMPKNSYDSGLCLACNVMSLGGDGMEKTQLNHLLKYVLHRIRSWIPRNITHKIDNLTEQPDWRTNGDLTWRANHLIFEQMDMAVLEVNILNEAYTSCRHFLTDVLTIRHNLGVFHGVKSEEYEAAEFILRDALHDLGEIIGCNDCYKHSNEKIHQQWFSIPCEVPHEIVWAKQKSYCYWPAKVVKQTESHCDVRFFGGKHERALISKQLIKPIAYPKQSLQLKYSAALKSAIAEMELHQQLSTSTSALDAFLASCKKKITVPKQWTRSPKKNENETVAVKPNRRKSVANNKKGEEMSDVPSSKVNSNNVSKGRRKSGRLSEPIKNDFEPPEVGSEVPIIKRRQSVKGDRKSVPTSWKPNRKRALSSQPLHAKNDTDSPVIGTVAPAIIGHLSKEDRATPEVGSAVQEIPAKKPKRGRRPSKKVTTPRKKNKSPAAATTVTEKVREKTQNNGIEIISISDDEDEDINVSSRINRASSTGNMNSYEQLEQVTSSSEFRSLENSSQDMQQLDHPFSDQVEMMGRMLETLSDKKEIIKGAMKSMQEEIVRIKEKHNDHLKRLFESHNAQISETKKKQWCYYCEQDAIYHCCWNTAYCSTTCQQQHWLEEHKRVCRRKR